MSDEALTLLGVIQEVSDRIGITRPTIVINSTDAQVRQLLGFANEEGLSLSRRGDWEMLKGEHSFITTATEEQTNEPLPEDFGRFIPDTFYDRTTQRKLVGPINSQLWQQMQARPASVAAYLTFRRRTGIFMIWPVPPAGDTIAYEYVSEHWVQSSAGQGKARYTSDDDESFLDTELIVQGIRWRWKAAKGLDYGEDMQTYERNVAQALGYDGGSMALDIGSGLLPDNWRANVPEGNWPG